ncbi:PREDICTED: uncharacterized protein LOC109218395 [Nicotiana attenuata]|uniref:uncharacterized protein LOC109218395 n=1 Tax=Nicotiana attenuata TaxID=49451 RepID=UPI000904C00F|nr:PREDICTED: uncharacterized protein LOC109218395 [Nicotiana attenuata]
MVDFVHSNIICRFGIPKNSITDNAANLNSHLMKEVCEQFKIVHLHSTPYHPKANGAVEAANKNFKNILRKMIQGSRQWHEKLHFAVLGYWTNARTSVRATPYLLVYGTEAEKEVFDHKIVGVSFDNASATQRLKIHLLNSRSGKKAIENEP